MKECFRCSKTKPLVEFYKHKEMADGRLNKCKECTRKDVAGYRTRNAERVREYDRNRAKKPHRIKDSIERAKRSRKENPAKHNARGRVARALRSGILQKEPCAVCNTMERIEAHHFDYSKPLEVVWLCSLHHSAVHYAKPLYGV